MAIELKSFYAKHRKAWRQWLQKHHKTAPGVWLIYDKKGSGKTRLSYSDAVEEALCFGWIDTIAKPIDEDKYMQKFTPRKIKSGWSALNKKRVQQLIDLNLMQEAGYAIIEVGKQNGSWTSLDHVENYTIPPDLARVFEKNKIVQRYFEALSKSPKKLWLYRLASAKLAATRQKRISELIEEAKRKGVKGEFVNGEW